MRHGNRPVLLSQLVGLIGSLGLLSPMASAQTGTWEPTGSMNSPRVQFSATLLRNGKVLVAGGQSTWIGGIPLASAELYDPRTGHWTATGSMTEARTAHTASLLADGKVLVAGGYYFTDGMSALASAELYDPSTGTWTPTGSMSDPRGQHMATVLTVSPLVGRVLVAGGVQFPSLASAELYDPSTGTWSETGRMTLARYFEQNSPATLPNGSVLIVGGWTCCPYHTFNRAETYDPATQRWTPTSVKTTKANGRTTTLDNGKVLVASGRSGTAFADTSTVAATELFDAAYTWTPTARMSVPRGAATATKLLSGLVLVAGGFGERENSCIDHRSAELFGLNDGWRPAGNMATARALHDAVLLPIGEVLVVGGLQSCDGIDIVLASAELYRPPQ